MKFSERIQLLIATIKALDPTRIDRPIALCFATPEKIMLTANYRQALFSLSQLSRNFDPWDLMGPSNVKLRQNIMTLLVGKKLPQAKCGVNALKDEFYKVAKPQGDCSALRDDAFAIWAKEQIAQLRREADKLKAIN